MASPEMRRRSLEILSWCYAFHVFELPAHSFSVFVHLNAQTVSKSLSNLFFLLDSVWSSCKITFYGLLPSVFVWFSIPCSGCGWLVIYLPYCLPVLFWFNIFILDICCGVPWEIYLGCFFPKNSGDTELGLSMIAYLSTALKLLIDLQLLQLKMGVIWPWLLANLFIYMIGNLWSFDPNLNTSLIAMNPLIHGNPHPQISIANSILVNIKSYSFFYEMKESHLTESGKQIWYLYQWSDNIDN